MLIPFPIAYLVGALLSDFTYLATEDFFWARASMWLIGAGLVMGVTAAIFGLIDFLSRPAIREHRIAWHHFIGNASVLILALINLYMRIDAPVDGLTPNGVVLSLITVGILVYTGWLGGEMAYRYKIGTVTGATSGRVSIGRAPGDERRMGPDDRRASPAM
jgi:uncharacterized membrane protein